MPYEIWQLALLVGVGIAAGFLNVMAGGGSLLTIPVMLFMGVPAPVANGTNRIAILAQNAAAVITFLRRGFSDFRLSLTLALCALPGAVIGAMVGANLDGIWFNRILAMVMLAVMVVMVRGGQRPAYRPEPGAAARHPVLGHILMAGVGFWGGFIQIGVGFMIMPVLNRVMGLDLVRTNMHKVMIVFIYTLVALLVFVQQAGVLWLLGAVLAVGNSVGGWLGAHLAVRRGETLIRRVLYAVLVVFVIKLLFFP